MDLENIVLAKGGHADRSNGLCAMESPCIEFGGEFGGYRDDKGYGRIYHQKRWQYAHRVAWMTVRGPIPKGLCVLHRCDNPPCVNVDHLFLGTLADNVADRERKGRGVPPPSRRKLTMKEAQKMRERYGRRGRGGVIQEVLAREFGVSRGNVSKIVNGRSHQGEEA